MDMVIRWRKTFIPHTVYENIENFIEAEKLVEAACKEYGSASSINLFDKYKCIASLRIFR